MPCVEHERHSRVRVLQDPDVVHTEDRVDPVEDLEIIHHELRLKDIERMQVSRQPASCCCSRCDLLEYTSLRRTHGFCLSMSVAMQLAGCTS